MRKLIIISVIFLLSTSAFSGNFYLDLDFENYYDSNILRLSDPDIERFKNGTDPSKFRLETIDDLIVSTKIQMNFKHRKFFGHTQVNRFGIKYNKFIRNGLKDNLYLEFALKQYLSRELNLGFYYYYYPEIYLNRYDSVWDEDESYRDFTYSKNYYIAKFSYDVRKKLQFDYKFKYSQLFHNEYFTEYDADKIEHEFELGLDHLEVVQFELIYSYEESEAINSATDPGILAFLKDAGYKEDNFKFNLEFPKLLLLFSKNLKANATLEYAKKYYQTKNEMDIYHYGRIDSNLQLDLSLDTNISDEMQLVIYTEYENRDTDSPFHDVTISKTYDLYKFGWIFKYTFFK